MSSVNEQIVREYLESAGFLVRQPRKYQVVARSKGLEEEVDFLAVNPSGDRAFRPAGLLWKWSDLKKVHAVLVGIRGWHSEKFTAAVLAGAPEVYRFASPESVQLAESEMGVADPLKVVCLADLPSSRAQREESLAFLKEKGIDGVLLFRPMLQELAERIDVKKTYEKSDLLQVLRILRNYDLLKDRQMDLFKSPSRRKGS